MLSDPQLKQGGGKYFENTKIFRMRGQHFPGHTFDGPFEGTCSYFHCDMQTFVHLRCVSQVSLRKDLEVPSRGESLANIHRQYCP